MIPFCCKLTQIDGRDYIAVPKGVYQVILLVPKTGAFSTKENGTRITAQGVGDNDWSLKTDLFLNDTLMGPYKRMEIILDRDADSGMPVVKLELIGG